MKPLTVLVCGGRDFKNRELLFNRLDDIANRRGIGKIIHGACAGADHLAKMWAYENGVDQHGYEAEWHKHGKRAGPIRNQRMLDEGKPDLVVAFEGGRGTADMVKRAMAAGVEIIRVVTP